MIRFGFCISLASCVGELESQQEAHSVAAGTPPSGSQPLDTSSLDVASGAGLSFQTDGLMDTTSEFSGSLTAQVSVFRTGHFAGSATYHSAFFPDLGGQHRYTSGLPVQWNRPWLGRIVLSGAPLRAWIEFPDGSREEILEGFSETQFPTEAGGGRIASDIRRTTGLSRWTPTSDGKGGIVLRVTTRAGLVYRFDHGACWPASINTQIPFWSLASCDASGMEDHHGNGVRVFYYGDTDADPTNDTHIPRVLETYRTVGDGNAPSVTGRAYFHLVGSFAGDAPPLGEPTDRFDLGGNANAGDLPSATTTGSRFIRAISYPGPNSDPLSADASWHHTLFSYRTERSGWNGFWPYVTALTSIATEGRLYRFGYGGALLQHETLGVTAPYGSTVGTMTRVDLPHGQSLSFAWQIDQVVTDTDFPDRTTSYPRVRRRSLAGGAVDGATFTWSLHRADLPATSSRPAFHAVEVSYPTGMSTLRMYHPLTWAAMPGAAKTGRLARAYIFDRDIWPETAEQPFLPLDQVVGYAVQEQLLGYATVVAGRSAPMFSSIGHANALPDGWIALPSFEVANQYAAAVQANAYCETGSVNGARVTCAGVAAPVQPACLTGDGYFATRELCLQGLPPERCYATSLGALTGWCGSFDGAPHGVPLCPTGTSSANNCDPVAAARVAHAVVTQHRESLDHGFFLQPFQQNDRASFDEHGNAPFRRRFASDDVAVHQEPVSCWGYVGNDVVRPWTCKQDTVTATPSADASLREEVRFAYVLETQPAGFDRAYASADLNMPYLVGETRACQIGTSCADTTTGLLGLERSYYDDRHPDGEAYRYPFQDAAGDPDRSLSPVGQRTYHERVLLERPSASERSFARFYGRGSGEYAGALAEQVTQTGPRRYVRTRLSYRNGTGTSASPDPTRQWSYINGTFVDAGRVTLNTWQQPLETVGPNGEVSRTCYDTLGRPIALYEHNDDFSGCPSSIASATTASTVLEYFDAPRWTARLTSRARRGEQSFTETTQVFLDGLGRTYHQQQSFVADDGTPRVIATSAAFLAHTASATRATLPISRTGSIGDTSLYGFAGARSETEYDTLSRPSKNTVFDAGGAARSTTFTSYGNTIPGLAWNALQSIDPQNALTVAMHDGFGRVSQHVLPDSSVVRRTYDALGRESQTIHPDGLTSTVLYDSLGRITRTASPESGTTSYEYDWAGQLTKVTRANGRQTHFAYDEAGRLRSRRQGAAGITQPDVDFGYDSYVNTPISLANRNGRGRLTSARFEAGEVHFGYDQLGNVVEQRVRLDGLPEKVLSRRFDVSGGLEEQTLQQSGERDFSQLEFIIGLPRYEPSEIRFRGTSITDFAFDELGRIRTQTLRNGNNILQALDHQYDELSRFVGINDPGELGNDMFAYRLRSDRPTLNAISRKDGIPVEVEWAHRDTGRAAYLLSYDIRQQLTGADYRVSGANGWSNTTDHDLTVFYRTNGIGQIQSLARGNADGTFAATDYTYDAANRQLRRTDGAEATSLAHDLAGNVTENAMWGENATIGYTSIGRTRYVANATHRVEYKYDYAGEIVVMLRQPWQFPCPASGGLTANGTVVRGSDTRQNGGRESVVGCYVTNETRHIVRDPDGQPVAEYVNGEVARLPLPGIGYHLPEGHRETGNAPAGNYYVLEDHLGSVRAVLNQQGQLLESRDYDPFGLAFTQPLNSTTQHAFATYRRDSVGGHDFLLAGSARIYNPQLGQFMSSDPLAAADPFHHGYAYVRNNPIALSDPSGLWPTFPLDILLPQVDVVGKNGQTPRTNAGLQPVHSMFASGQPSRAMLTPTEQGESTIPASPIIFRAPSEDDGYRGPTMGPISTGEINTLDRLWEMQQAADFRQMRREQYIGLAMALVSLGQSGGSAAASPSAGSARNAVPPPSYLSRLASSSAYRYARQQATSAHPPATVVGAFNPRTGGIFVGRSQGGGRGCAEGDCVRQAGTSALQFVPAVRPRAVLNGRTPPFIPACANCEAAYGRGAFRPGVPFATDGARAAWYLLH